MKDLELSRGFEIPNAERNYQRIDERTLRSSSRTEDIVIRDEVVPVLRSREFPVYSTTYVPRETIHSTPLGIQTAILELEDRGFTEGQVFDQSWTGGTMDNDLRE